MKAKFREITYHHGKPKKRGRKTVRLPFTRISARALIVRRSDGAVLGVRHERGRRMALPGGGVDDGETPAEALRRELAEEDITLTGAGEGWEERFGVDYYDGYRELNFWFLITADDAHLAPNPEIVEWAWVPQSKDPWYPLLRPLILVLIEKYVPDLLVKQRF